jgi:predicted AAA+ superfamily ATPase
MRHTPLVSTVPSGLRRRHLLPEIKAALGDTRVVLIAGARQVGKSTTADIALAGMPDAMRLTLDDPLTLAAAREDPSGVVQHSGILFIDEVQRVPELLLAIKAVVDRSRRPGQFLLTGSANILTLPKVVDALPGRMQIINLWPFSQGEIEGQIDGFVDRAFAEVLPDRTTTTLTKGDYLLRATRGGFPEVVIRTAERRRAAWFDGYVSTLIQRDIRDVADVGHIAEVPRILRLLAARSAQPLSIRNLASDAGLPATTVSRYVDILETAFVLARIPGWETSKTTRATRMPKVYLRDTGLLCHLLGVDATALSHPLGDAGPVLETFAVMELARQLGWSSTRATLYHYRSRDSVEVDIVLEAADGRIVGVEVKAAATVRSKDFAGLRHIAQRAGDRFRAGIVLHTGPHSLPFGERLWALPFRVLWQP